MKKYLNSKKLAYICAVLSTIMMGGCAGHTVNLSPDASINPPQRFSVLTDEKAFHASWWQSFSRPTLDELIEQALNNNYDLAQSIAILKQARAISHQTQSRRLPQVDVRGRTAKDWEGSDEQRSTSDVGSALTWEIDIWERINFAAKADRLEAQARFEDIQTLKLSISAEVAAAYFGAISAQQRINLLQQQLKLDRDLLNLLELRLDSGVGTTLEVLQQQARVADSETLIPIAEADRAVFENRLDVLLGQNPDAQSRVPASETLLLGSDIPAIGVPAALLLNRPDLRALRAELIAADYEIAAAIADRLPRITLEASLAYSDITAYTGPTSMIMGTFIQPLLDWGRRKAEVERNKALYEERLAAYTQLFLEAVEDVENALIREKKQREFLLKLNHQRDILQQTANASEDRYTQGIDDYLPVINALQELRQVERDLITAQRNLINIRIDLFRAIGGPVDADTNKDALNPSVQIGNNNETP